ncbi:MAG TPA: zf-HC2 domain-containing protein [Candidatus Didemnitutus sp.]|nr:zf-HC2 domain-containing protein [Candidatus Didemnitutus sp.]
MNCDEARTLLAAHLDGELDVVRDAAVVAHLNHCPACAAQALAHAARRGLVQEKAMRHAAPADLRAGIVAQLRGTERPVVRPIPVVFLRQVLPIAAGLVVAGLIGFQWGAAHMRNEAAVDEYTTAYVRGTSTGHSLDVISTDRHTVKPWFVGKIDFAPSVHDFAAQEFPLVGGRLDRVAGQPAAVLVYHRRKHVIDVYVTQGGGSALPAIDKRFGFNLVSWTQDGLRYVAVSDLAASELGDFARLCQSAKD